MNNNYSIDTQGKVKSLEQWQYAHTHTQDKNTIVFHLLPVCGLLRIIISIDTSLNLSTGPRMTLLLPWPTHTHQVNEWQVDAPLTTTHWGITSSFKLLAKKKHRSTGGLKTFFKIKIKKNKLNLTKYASVVVIAVVILHASVTRSRGRPNEWKKRELRSIVASASLTDSRPRKPSERILIFKVPFFFSHFSGLFATQTNFPSPPPFCFGFFVHFPYLNSFIIIIFFF